MSVFERSRGRAAWWVLAAAAVALGLAVMPGAARGAGGTYNVVQCHDYNAYGKDAVPLHQGGYLVNNLCATSAGRYQITPGWAGQGRQGSFAFAAPPGTSIWAFSLAFDGRSADGHWAEVAIVQDGREVLIWRAPNQATGYVNLGPYFPLHAWQLVVRLQCHKLKGCGPSGLAHVWARNVAIELRDHADPSINAAGGSLLSGGWLRGARSLSAASSDYGSGVVSFEAFVNGARIANAGVACNGETPPFTAHLVPCRGAPHFAVSPSTASAPFHNGTNRVVFRASDYAGNLRFARYMVRVDNAPPSIAFENSQNPHDPELIRAPLSDQHSGIAEAKLYFRAAGTAEWKPLPTEIKGGAAQTRVDSLAQPAGEYEFRAEARDVAGNTTTTTRRRDGEPMRLTFPLRSAVELRAHLNHGASKGQVVRYGTDAKAKGVLLDRFGDPLAGQSVTVVEHFGDGALIRERVSYATTDERGKWRSKLPAGPSRSVEASFGGTRALAPASRAVGTFTVRSKASFRTSRRNVPEGRAIRFKGKVRHFGARIPSGGKLVELQVRMKPGEWDTIGEAFRTNEKGRYRRRYRFGRHYTSDARFRFRVKVKREANWPYRRTTTRRRKVIVRAR